MNENGGSVGVVLAGGQSRRFEGGDKALAELNDTSLVDRAVSAVDEATDAKPVVAVRDERGREATRQVLETEPRFVTDDEMHEGPVAGLAAAVRAVELPRVFVCGCDMPFVDPDVVRSLLGGLSGTEAVAPVDNGVLDPLHSALRRSAAVDALNDTSLGDGVYDLLNCLDTETVEKKGAVRRSAININTRAELEELRRCNSRRF